MANYRQYETRPIDCWNRAVELRREHRRHIWEAQQKGELLVHGMAYFHSVLGGMGDFAITEFTPNFRVLMNDPREAIKCHETAEARGLGADICSSMRCHLGALYRGFTLVNREGKSVKPDFIFQGLPCFSLAKTGQLYADFWQVPYFTVDIPHIDRPAIRQFLVEHLQEFIEWMEGITGRRFNDEQLIEGARNEWESLSLFARILDLVRVVPAPLDVRQLLALQLPLVLSRHKREVVDFYQALYDETVERVRQGISARGYEERRLIHGGFPPMYYMGIFRYPGQYGAIYAAADLIHLYAGWESLDQGKHPYVPMALTPEAAGLPMRNRGDALRALAQLYIAHRPHMCRTEARPEEFLHLVKQWRGDGVIFHIDRGCKNMQSGILEAKLALDEAGVPTLVYESSGYDPRDFTESQVLDRMDTFLEGLGLTRTSTEKTEGFGSE